VFTRRKGGQNSSLRFQCNIFSNLFYQEELHPEKTTCFAGSPTPVPSLRADDPAARRTRNPCQGMLASLGSTHHQAWA
jgi:hypothetical protein